MYFLVFFVVDATVLCVHFVRGLQHLRGTPGNWPEATLTHFTDEVGIPSPPVEIWIDLQFIARRTRCVTQLIYYPFIVLSLWLLSRNPAFDRWNVTVGTLAPAVLGAAVALGCALALHWAAEKSRADALERLRNDISLASGPGR